MFASVFGAHFVMCFTAQMVEEGIRASSVPAVLEKCVNDLLDLTDLVRGKLGVQVRVSPAGSSHINQPMFTSCLWDSSDTKGIGHEPGWTCIIYKCCPCNSAQNAPAQELIDPIAALLCNHRSALNCCPEQRVFPTGCPATDFCQRYADPFSRLGATTM